jgi:hypothetical protein
MVERSPTTSVRRISDRVGTSWMQVWRSLYDVGLHPFHVQTVQSLQSTDYIPCVVFCRWLLGNQPLLTKIYSSTRLRSTETESLMYGLDMSGLSIILTHPRKHFQSRFLVTMWCCIIGNQFIGPFVLEERLTSVSWKMSCRCC